MDEPESPARAAKSRVHWLKQSSGVVIDRIYPLALGRSLLTLFKLNYSPDPELQAVKPESTAKKTRTYIKPNMLIRGTGVIIVRPYIEINMARVPNSV